MNLKEIKAKVQTYGRRAAIAVVPAVATVGSASATGYTFNGTLSDIAPILADAVALMPDILGLALSVVPIMIAFSLVAFLTGLFDGIISQISFRRH